MQIYTTPPLIGYGQTIEWTGGSVHTEGHATPEAALASALRMAEAMGWTRPRWWQFWRWSERRVPVLENSPETTS